MKSSSGARPRALTAVLGVLCWSTTAGAAGHANNFGDKGQLMISADRLLPVFSYTYASTTSTQNGQDLTVSRGGAGLSLLLGRNLAAAEDFGDYPINVHTLPRIAADFTIIEHLTLGAGLAIGFGLGGSDKREFLNGNVKSTASTNPPKITAIGIAPRVGYIIPFGDYLAFWPRGGFGFYSVSAHSDIITQNNPNATSGTRSLTDTILSLDLDPQLAIVPFEHFFFHVGPMINIPLSGSRTIKDTNGATTTSVSADLSLFNFGISGGLGGWFNL